MDHEAETHTDAEVEEAQRRFTVRSQPPETERPQRRGWWAALFDECRECPDEWRRTVATFSKSTASQLASDIRNGHLRDPRKMRVRGILPGECWEARWGAAHSHDYFGRYDDGAPEKGDTEPRYFVWLRFVVAA